MSQARYYINVDLAHSTSATNPVVKATLERDIQDFGEHRYFGLGILPNQECYLDPKHRYINKLDITELASDFMVLSRFFSTSCTIPEKIIPGPHQNYLFVIVEDKDKKPLLKINMGGSHYLLSGSADKILAAGTMRFDNKKLVSFDDESGAYQVDLKKISKEERDRYKASLMRAFTEVGLPPELFTSEYFDEAEKEKKPASSEDLTITLRKLSF